MGKGRRSRVLDSPQQHAFLPAVESLEPRLLLDGVMLGNPVAYPAGSNPHAVVAGDFDGDGRLDMAVMSSLKDTVTLSRALPQGGYAPSHELSLWDPRHLAAGDFNGDGRMDLAVSSSIYNLTILLGQPDGTLLSAGTFSGGGVSGGPVVAADFSNDGLLDVAVGSGTNNAVDILDGQGGGVVGNRLRVPVGFSLTTMAAADFNGDGLIDLALGASDSTGVRVLLGQAEGGFAAPVTYASAAPQIILCADFTGDGLVDIALSGVSYLGILAGGGDGTFAPVQTHGVSGLVRSFGDVNGDGALDVVSLSGNQASVYYGLSGGGFGHREDYAAGATPKDVAVVDLDGSGLPELAIADYGLHSVRVLTNQGAFPDLVVDAVLTRSGVLPGEWVDVQVRVDNIGYGASAAAEIAVYLSADATVDSSDTLIGAFTADAMPNWTAFSQTVRLTACAAGTYYIRAVADGQDLLVEAREDNNGSAVRSLLVGPDLSVQPTVGAFAAAPDETVNVPVRVRNAAAVDAGGFRVALEMSPTADFSREVVLVGQCWLAALSAQSDCQQELPVTAPSQPGRYYLRATVDADGSIAEYDEGNNLGQVMSLTVGADLAMTFLGSSWTAAGCDQQIEVILSNDSPVPVADTFEVHIYLSNDATVDAADALVAVFICPGIGAWESFQHTLTITMPGTAGEHFLIGVVDPLGVVPEAPEDLGNNVCISSAAVLPVHQLLRTSMLTPGTRWTYDFVIEKFENRPLNRPGIATVSVSAGPTVIGIPTVKMAHVVPGMYSEWEYVARNLDGYVMLGLGFPGASFLATEPLLVMPEYISEGDNSLHVGHGRLVGTIQGVPGKLTAEADSYVSYLGTETLQTPAGTFECTIVGVDLYFELSNGWFVEQHLTWWIDPDAGPIRRDFRETSWTPDPETTSYSCTRLLSTNAQGRPDLRAAAAPLPADRVPGDKVLLPVTVLNSGRGKAVGKMDITIYASASGQLDGSEIELARLVNQSVSLAVGASKTYTAKITLPALPQGQYSILAVVDSGGAIDETDEANNLAISSEATQVLWQFGNVAGRRNVKLTVEDLLGQPVTFSLTGPGVGQVTLFAEQLGVGVVNSTPASSLTIIPASRGAVTSVDAMLVEGSLKAIEGSRVDLRGPMYVLGSLGSLRFHDALAGSEVVLGRSYEGGPPLAGIASAPQTACMITFNHVTDSRIESAAQVLKSISASQWTDSNAQWDVLAPRLDKLMIKGDFQADLRLGGPGTTGVVLGSLQVMGVWDDSNISLDGHDARLGLSVKSLSARQVGDVNVTASGGIGTVFTSHWQSGLISAGWLGSVTSSADRALGTSGDFGAHLQLTGVAIPASKLTLGSARIARDLLDETCWDVQAGLVGSLTFGGTVRQSVIRSAGNIKSITVGATEGSDFGAGVAMSVLESSRHVMVGDVAGAPKAAIGTFTVKGLKVPKGTPAPRFFVDSCISAGVGNLNLLNWDGQGGLFAPAGSIKSVRHKDTADKTDCWAWPVPPTQMSAGSGDFIHII